MLGQDGLVANTLKYTGTRPVVGVNPDPGRFDGVLLPFLVRDLPKSRARDAGGSPRASNRSRWRKASLNDGRDAAMR